MRRWVIAGVAGLALVASIPATAQRAEDDQGVQVRRLSLVRNLVPAARIEKIATEQYEQLRAEAVRRNALAAADDPQMKRLQRIADDLLPHTYKWNARAKTWKWETLLIKTSTVNALCMPGGKIAVFMGVLDQLKLNDDELAIVMGHEMAHALREHGRARAAKTSLTNVTAFGLGLVFGGDAGRLAQQGGGLFLLKFNRDDERDADLVGLEVAARAGYDPRAGISLWEKMSQVAKTMPMSWLSTHPSGEERIARIKESLKQVLPLYEKARAKRQQSSGN